MKKLPRKVLVSLALAAGISAPIANPALAAVLSNGTSQTCDGAGVFHFVNNQTGTTTPGQLTATFDIGGVPTTSIVNPSKINRSVQQFIVNTFGDATLVTASTNLPGRLVLSDFTCTPTPPPPPPPPGTD